MIKRLSMCSDCGASILYILPKGVDVLQKLINNVCVVVEGGSDGFFGCDGREEMRCIESYFDLPGDKKPSDFADFLGAKIGYYKHRIYASKDVWFILYAIFCGGLDYVECKIEKNCLYHVDHGNIHKIESVTVKKGALFYEWYDEISCVDVVLDDTSENCPLCGGEVRVPHRDMKSLRIRGRLITNSFLDKKLTPFLKECENSKLEIVNKQDIASKEELVTYLKRLVGVENSIRFYCECFRNIYFEHWLCRWDVNNDKISIKMELEKNKREIEKKIEEIDSKLCIENEILNDKKALARKYGIKYPDNVIRPQEPSVQKPVMPTMLKAGLFNKSKVEKENDMLLETYYRELKCYDEKWTEYNKELKRYNESENCKIEFEKQYPSLLSKQHDEVQKWSVKKEEVVVSKLNVEQNNKREISNLLKQRKSAKLLEFYEEELEETKNILRELINCKAQLHSLDIVFPKYLEYVSIVTILEYFESGRCSELTGADGAYNLYESELRQNIIIGKLDDIVERLDDIKNNQYLVYTSLQNINNSINSLDETFQKAVDSLENIEQTTTSIKENTAMTAYYSAKTAEYTKRNAELTNALGYLVAFK